MTTSSRTALAEVTKNAHISAAAIARYTKLLSGITSLAARNGSDVACLKVDLEDETIFLFS